MALRFVKTAAGLAEIKSRGLELTRPVRNLLLLIGPSHDGHHWVSQVDGCSWADLYQLLDLGLIVSVESSQRAAQAAAQDTESVLSAATTLPPEEQETPATAAYVRVRRGVRRADQVLLRAALQTCATRFMGRFSGFRLTRAVERTERLSDLQALTLRLADEWLDEERADALERLAEALAVRRRPPAA